MYYLEMYCLVTKYLSTFVLPFCYWFLVWLHYGWRTYSMFYGQYLFYPWTNLMDTLRECEFCYYCVKYFLSVVWWCWILLCLVDFPSSYSINCWERYLRFFLPVLSIFASYIYTYIYNFICIKYTVPCVFTSFCFQPA